MGDRRSESVNRSLTVSPRHAPLTRGLNIKPRPFLGWAARFLSLLLPARLFPFPLAPLPRPRDRDGEQVRARPLLSRFSIGLSKQRLVLTFIAIIAVISAGPRRCETWYHDVRASVQIADASLVDCMARLLRATAIYYGNSAHSCCSSIDTGLLLLRYGPLAEFALWLPRIGRSNFFAIPFFFLVRLMDRGYYRANTKKKNGRCNFRRCSNYRSKRKIKDKKDVLLIQDLWINCYRTVRLFEIVRLVLKIERMEYFGRM